MPGTTSDFGAFQQPIISFIRDSDCCDFEGETSNDGRCGTRRTLGACFSRGIHAGLSALPQGVLQVLTHVTDFAEYRMSSYHLDGKNLTSASLLICLFEANTSYCRNFSSSGFFFLGKESKRLMILI